MVKRLRWFALLLVALFTVSACGSTHSATPNPLHRLHSAEFIQQAEHPGLPATAYRVRPTSATSLVQGYDDVTLSRIPANSSFTGAIGCYAVGSFTNCPAASSRFPRAHIVSITPTAGGVAKVLDTEQGDAVPAQDPGWVRWMYSRNVYGPAIYASSYEMSQVRADLNAAGLSHCSGSVVVVHCYLLWVAAWDGNPGIPAGYDAHQWFGGMVIDKDTFASYFFAPPRPPKPNLPGCTTSSTLTSHCYGRFPTIKVYNKTKGAPCSLGCIPRDVVKSYDRDIFGGVNSIPSLKRDQGKLAFLDARALYLRTHRSFKINKANYLYGDEHEYYNRAHRHRVCGNWKICDF